MPAPTTHDIKREPVISTDLAEAIADLLAEYGIDSPYSVDYGNYSVELGTPDKPPRAYLRIPYDWEGLPDFWTLDVSVVIARRKMVEFEKRYHEAVDALEGPYVTDTVRTYLHEQYDRDGWADPEPCDLGRLRNRFLGVMNDMGRDWSRAMPKLPVLHLDHAIFFNRRPDAWADYAAYIVPMDLTSVVNVPLDDLLQAMHLFVDALRTSNGYSGVGSSWTVHIHPSSEFVILTSRSSIPE